MWEVSVSKDGNNVPKRPTREQVMAGWPSPKHGPLVRFLCSGPDLGGPRPGPKIHVVIHSGEGEPVVELFERPVIFCGYTSYLPSDRKKGQPWIAGMMGHPTGEVVLVERTSSEERVVRSNSLVITNVRWFEREFSAWVARWKEPIEMLHDSRTQCTCGTWEMHGGTRFSGPSNVAHESDCELMTGFWSSAPKLSDPELLVHLERFGCPKCDNPHESDEIDVTILEDDHCFCMTCEHQWVLTLVGARSREIEWELDKRYAQCGLNADWSVTAWHLGEGEPNTAPGDTYVLDSEDGEGTYQIVRRWYLGGEGYEGDGFNDDIRELGIATKWSDLEPIIGVITRSSAKLHMDQNYWSIAPVWDDDSKGTFACLSVENEMSTSELADRLEAFAKFIRKNPSAELSGSVD